MERRTHSRRLFLRAWLTLAAAFVCGAGVNVAAQETLAPQESRGKQIYVQGTSPSGGEILAYIGESSLEVPGSVMACANCHGLDGKGKPEGGVVPSNLTWEVLTKPYGLTHEDGRRHPPYTERALELAITRGTDPAGNKLLGVMPRYQMSREDLADLAAYIKRLGKDPDPGVGEDKLVIGTALPASGELGETGQAVKALLTAFFAELNGEGGVYGRRIELKFADAGETPEATRAGVERLLNDGRVFAMTGTFIAGAEKEVLPFVASKGVPLVGPLTLYTQTEPALNRQVFYLLPGIEEQARALVEFAVNKREKEKPRPAVAYPRSEINARLLAAIKEQSKKEGLEAPQDYGYEAKHFDAADAVRQLRGAGRDVVFFMGGGGEALAFMAEAEEQGWLPTVLLPSAGVGPDIFGAPAGFDGKLFVSFPTSPAAQTPEGVREFRALAEKYNLPPRRLAAQMSAFCAAKVLVEALKRAGKDVSRERLIQSLEGLYDYRTGLTPAVTFGPNRRVGATGAYVVSVDLKGKQFVPAGGWVSVD
jgi:ABC-type branched-subunit amino acid transport system substrate-binding protein